eukprot:CAMPEP_0181295838 /NCGR_PEP_ID=MMETSP1101-20121128/4365_1 /TAXON_ID=46948 /ORGANISM="Rhodomonas abbreviata, Strain Caron Lab Isolate" /LENGTH=237 /DNA_ID=CAMNT_0023400625 /DNA_START=23 /DNA_END=736 /DNA_ORIENTATION=+
MSQDLVALNAKAVAYLGRHDARDKLCRSIAYGSDFVVWVLRNSGQEVLMSWIKQIMKMKSGVGVARKCFRVGAPLKDLDAIAKIPESGSVRVLKTIMHTANACYYTLDHIELMTIFEILPYKTAEIKVMRYRIWWIKTIINIFLILKGINETNQAIKAAKKAAKDNGGEDRTKLEALYEKNRKLKVTLIMGLADCPVGLFVVSDWGKRNIGAHGAGLSGWFGSTVAAMEIWRQTKGK